VLAAIAPIAGGGLPVPGGRSRPRELRGGA
jgi:hypothetical protein